MAQANFQLASRNFSPLQTSGARLSPALLSGAAAGGLRAAQISGGAGTEAFTPLPTQRLTQDNTLENLSKFGNTLIQETQNFQARQDQVTSDDIKSRFAADLQKKWVGYENEDGKFVEGYSSKKGKEANATYGVEIDSAQQMMKEYLEGVPEAARQEATLGMAEVFQNFRDRAAGHNSKQLDFAEQEERFKEGQVIAKEFEIDPGRAFGQLQVLAGKAATEKEKVEIMNSGMTHGIATIQQQIMQQGGSKEAAWQAANVFFEKNRESIPQDTENVVASKLSQQKDVIEAELEAKRKEAQKNYQARIEHTGASEVYKILNGGPNSMPAMGQYVKNVYAAYPDDKAKADDTIAKTYKEGLRAIMQSEGLVAAEVAWKNLQSTAEKNSMYIGDIGVLTETNKFVNGALRTENAQLVVQADNGQKREIYKSIRKAKTVQEVEQLQSELYGTDLSAGDMSFLDGTATNQISKIENSQDEAVKTVQDTNFLALSAEAGRDGASPDFEARVWKMEEKQEITGPQAEKVLARAEKTSGGAVSPGYKALNKQVKTLVETEDMIYDPVSRKTQFRSMLSEEQIANIETNLTRLGRSDTAVNILATASIMEEAERWKKDPANKGREYDNFLQDYYSQQPEVKRGFLNNFARQTWNLLTWDYLGEFDTGPAVEAVEYTPATPATPAEIPETRGVSGIRMVQKPTNNPMTNPVDISSPKRMEEFAVTSIPDNYKSDTVYSEMNVDGLLALEMVREAGYPVDELSFAEIKRTASDIQKTPEFIQWKRIKSQALQTP